MSREKKRNNKGKPTSTINCHLELEQIKPITPGQIEFFENFQTTPHHILHGFPGTGKTFCALYLALKQLLNKQNLIEKIVIVRSAVPTRDIGFLPGTLEEKIEAYVVPYEAIFCELFNRGDAFEICRIKSMVEVMSTSYIRGITLDNAIIIVDEAQNMTFHELDSIITRVGNNTRIVFCGDGKQTDFGPRSRERSGLSRLMYIAQHMPTEMFGMVEFTEDDIVRSDFVKEYIITRERVDKSE